MMAEKKPLLEIPKSGINSRREDFVMNDAEYTSLSTFSSFSPRENVNDVHLEQTPTNFEPMTPSVPLVAQDLPRSKDLSRSPKISQDRKIERSKDRKIERSKEPQGMPMPQVQELGVVSQEPPALFSNVKMDDIVVHSNLQNQDNVVQTRNILRAFNQDRPSIMVESVLLGKRIKRNEFRLVHRNNTPELVGFTQTPLRKQMFATGETQDMGIFRQTQLLIGAHGSFVVNVPRDKLCKAWDGTNPLILGPGPHVIHSNTFHLDRNNPLVSSNFAYFSHNIYHVLRIPNGKLAKIWIGSVPYLLESRSEPYVFANPLFRLQRKDENELFEDTSTRLITHGSIKRVMPRTGEVAITYNVGNLTILKPNVNGKPIVITSENHIVDGFLPTNIQTIVFPTEKTKQERRRRYHECNGASSIEDFVNYEEFRTKDGLPIGVRLLVVFTIVDPLKALAQLDKDGIVPHIENLVVADMGAVIQRCTSNDFQNTDLTKTMPDAVHTFPNPRTVLMENANFSNDPLAPSAPPPSNTEFIRYLQDSVKNKLSNDFLEYGIKLDRVNIETPKILDQNVASKMAEYSLMTSETNAKESIMQKKFNIAEKEAEQVARQKSIAQNQTLENEINAARTKLEAAKLRAEATKIETEAQAEAQKKLAQVQAELFEKYPKLFEFEMMKLQSKALSGIKNTVISPEIAKSMYPFGGMFGQPAVNKQKTNENE